MRPLNVVVLQGNKKSAEVLAARLDQQFRAVSLAASVEDLRRSLSRERVDLAVIDLEIATFEQIAALRREFSRTMLVATHRVPDDLMWTAALEAGAIDCCHNLDARAIALAAGRTQTPLARAAAAAA